MTLWDQMAKPEAPEECWNWIGTIKWNGYGAIGVNERMMPTHRYAYERFVGTIPPGHVVRHMCGNRKCCRPSHLTTGTQSDNAVDSVIAGRKNMKITAETAVRVVRSAESAAVLARELGLSPHTIRKIRRGVRWAHSTGLQPKSNGLEGKQERYMYGSTISPELGGSADGTSDYGSNPQVGERIGPCNRMAE